MPPENAARLLQTRRVINCIAVLGTRPGMDWTSSPAQEAEARCDDDTLESSRIDFIRVT